MSKKNVIILTIALISVIVLGVLINNEREANERRKEYFDSKQKVEELKERLGY